MRVLLSVVLVVTLCGVSACDKAKQSKTENPLGAGEGSSRGAEEGLCRQACEKGPRLHFEEALKAELRRKPEAEHDSIKASAEERWKAMRTKHVSRVDDCVKQCQKTAKPGEVECLVAATNMAETQACVRKYQSRDKGFQPKKGTKPAEQAHPKPVDGRPLTPHVKEPHGPKSPVAPKEPKSDESPGAHGHDAQKMPNAPKVRVPAAKVPGTVASPKLPAVKPGAPVPNIPTPKDLVPKQRK